MPSRNAPDDIRHLAEPVCGICDAGLERDPAYPLSDDKFRCERCGQQASYTEIAKCCEDSYREFTDFLMRNEKDSVSELTKRWKPEGNYRFRVKIIDVGYEEDFSKCNAIPLNN